MVAKSGSLSLEAVPLGLVVPEAISKRSPVMLRLPLVVPEMAVRDRF